MFVRASLCSSLKQSCSKMHFDHGFQFVLAPSSVIYDAKTFDS
jgi:hypothetical protein